MTSESISSLRGVQGTTDDPVVTGEMNFEGPVNIKEILAQLDGAFPMDEAVVEGEPQLISMKAITCTNSDFSITTRKYISLSRKLWYQCLDNYRKGRSAGAGRE